MSKWHVGNSDIPLNMVLLKLAIQKAESEYAKYKAIERQQIHLESIKELDRDIKQLKSKK